MRWRRGDTEHDVNDTSVCAPSAGPRGTTGASPAGLPLSAAMILDLLLHLVEIHLHLRNTVCVGAGL